LVRSVFGIELPPLIEFYDRRGELDRFAPCIGDTGELLLERWATRAKTVDDSAELFR
jgi:hypothetical protein